MPDTTRWQYVSRLTEDEREMLAMFLVWLQVEGYSRSTAKLYHSHVAKAMALELKYDQLSKHEQTAWHRFEEFVEWAMSD